MVGKEEQPGVPGSEEQRLAALRSYHILDTVSEQDFDDLTELAAAICGTPIALISLVDEHRQWFKAARGLDVSETERAHSFCAHAINKPVELMQVPDATKDGRFSGNPLVTGEPNIVFYAGIPLVNPEGYALGSLCVIDSQTRILTTEQQSALRTLGRQVMDKLELRRTTHQLRKSENILKLAVEAASIASWEYDIDNGELSVSEHYCSMLGLPVQTRLHWQVLFEAVDLEYRETVLKAFTSGINEQDHISLTYSIHHPGTGAQRWIRSTGRVIEGKDGVPAQIIGLNIDITDEFLRQQTLEDAISRLNFAMDAGSLGSTEVEFATRNMQPSEQFLKNYGRNKDDVFTYDQLFESIDPEYREEIRNRVTTAIKTNSIYTAEYPITWPDGSRHWISAHGKPRYDAQGTPTHIVGLTENITEQVAARQALKESEERFRIMAEGSDVMIAVGDETGAATYFNEAWQKVTGRNRETLLKSGWIDLMHADDKLRVTKIFENAFVKKEPWEWEFRLPDADGSYRWFLARGTPRFNTDKTFAGYISSTVDITDFKVNDQRKSAFLGMVSHELKTPMTSIKGYLQVLSRDARSEGRALAAAILDRTLHQINKMNAIISGFLDASRYESGRIYLNRQAFDMAGLMEEVAQDVGTVITSHRVVFAPVERTPVFADRDKIGQVVNNFINNAVKYSLPGSLINVACVTNDGCAEVSVKDEGMGIDASDHGQLFDRYFRVEGDHMKSTSGFGIGLYICKEIIEHHDGRIWVDSERNVGSTFYFSLPVSDIAEAGLSGD